MADSKYKIIVASDINPRDGIGVELYNNDEIVIEVFRDDTKKTRTITTYKDNVSLEQMEKAIESFKKEIPWDFIKHDG